MSVTGLAGTELGAGRWKGTGRRARDFTSRLLGRADGLVGLTILAFFSLLALFPSFFVGPLQSVLDATGQPLQPPSAAYPFGTDELGR
ncbi:MAG TPA: hypothetical protein VID95_07545, partial [Candidatus Limnocylindrales bacterium]